MDNPPRFSLGITLLDATIQDIPLGFVPAKFNEQHPDWADNRSKHRNDPVTMKKLTDKAASKSKKSTSKASKKKLTILANHVCRSGITKTSFMFGVQGKILKFTMLEFTIISGLKCTDNIDDYMYTSSSKSALMSSYFPDNKGEITRSKLITRVQNGNFDNTEDALNLVILFFVHTFMFSQYKKAPISVTHFQIVEDGRTIPPREILMKAGFESPISPDQLHHGSNLYREMHKDATDKGEIDVFEIQHHHHVEIGVSLQSHQHKSVPSSSTQPEGTSKSSLGGDEIKNYINKCEVNAADKDAGHEDNFENGDFSDLQALEDEIMAYEEEYSDEELGKKNIPDVEDLLVWELQALKSKTPAKRERKKSRVLRSPYMSKYGSGSKDAIDIDKEEKLKYDFDGYNINKDLPNELMIDYSQWIAVGLLKPSANCFFKTYVEKTHTCYYPVESTVDLSTQQDYVESIVVVKNEDAIANIIQGFYMPAGLPWYMVNEASLEAYKGKITQQTGLVNEIPFDVDYVENIPQQASDSLDCGIFVCAYAQILSEGVQVHSCGFDSACQRARYASLLWHYGVEKANEG
ncbi:hypothetical protein BC332_20819 [Capsicum chinense]|nr:hypothetical protein BC332_20819 [Capsicum chinense]